MNHSVREVMEQEGALQRALAHHQAGEFAEAREVYERVLPTLSIGADPESTRPSFGLQLKSIHHTFAGEQQGTRCS